MPPMRLARDLAGGVVATLLGAALLLGSIEVHGTTEEHSALDAPAVVFSAARHAGQPAHVETSPERAVPRCAWCVLHLAGLGDALPAPGRLPGPQISRADDDDGSEQAACQPRRLAVSRGPPIA